MKTQHSYTSPRYFISRLLSFCLPLLVTLSGCKSLDMTVSVPQRKIPATYQFGAVPPLLADTTTIAEMKWREYFQDSLLVALIDTALQNNFSLQIALQRIEFARANSTYAKGELLPKVLASVGGGIRKFGLYTMDGAGNISTEIVPGKIVPINLPDLSIGIQTSWEIDIWGKLRSKSESAAAQYLASIEGTRWLVTSLIADIVIGYYELLALDTELDILRRTIQKQQEALGVIQLQKEAGRANELAVQQFEAQVLSTQAMEKETLQHITKRENILNVLAGRFPQPIPRKNKGLSTLFSPKFSAGIPAQLLQNRPDIREAELQLQSSKFDVAAARAAFFPSLNLTAGIGFQAFDPQLLFLSPASIAYNALGGLVAPLINWNGLEAQFASTKAGQAQAMIHYQKVIVNGYVEVINELSNIQSLHSIDSLKLQQSNVLQESVDIATDLYKSAKATYLEILLAQQASLQAQLDLVNIKKRQHIARVNVYKSLGGGWK